MNTRDLRNSNTPSLLVISYYPALRASRSLIAARMGWSVEQAGSKMESKQRLAHGSFNAVLICSTVSQPDAAAIMRAYRRHNPGGQVILVSDEMTDFRSADCVLQSAVSPQDLVDVLERVQERSHFSMSPVLVRSFGKVMARAAGA